MWFIRKKQTTDNSLSDTTDKSSQLLDPFAALRFRDYRLFTIGRILLSVAYQMQTVAVGWELYERTASAVVLGGVGLVQVLPVIVFTLIAGHLADRRDRKRILIGMGMMQGLCSLALAVLSLIQGSISLFVCLLAAHGSC